MIVKTRCQCRCGVSKILKVGTLKQARKIKRENKGWMCNRCQFKFIASETAKEIVRGLKRIC